MVGYVLCPPGRFGGGHLYDGAAEGPDVAGPAVAVPPQHLRGHERYRTHQVTLELTCGK